MRKHEPIEPGHVFHWWTVLRKAERDGHGSERWWVKCKCGTERIAQATGLRHGHTKSCGCSVRKVNGRLKRHSKGGWWHARITALSKIRTYRLETQNEQEAEIRLQRLVARCQELVDRGEDLPIEDKPCSLRERNTILANEIEMLKARHKAEIERLMSEIPWLAAESASKPIR
jgi:hypothetical protein